MVIMCTVAAVLWSSLVADRVCAARAYMAAHHSSRPWTFADHSRLLVRLDSDVAGQVVARWDGVEFVMHDPIRDR